MPNPDAEVQFAEREQQIEPRQSVKREKPSGTNESQGVKTDTIRSEERLQGYAKKDTVSHDRNAEDEAEVGSADSPPSATMYETPSPPSSESAAEYTYAESPRPRRKGDSTVVRISSNPVRSISPIGRDRSLWQQSKYVPVLADERTRLVPEPGDGVASPEDVDENAAVVDTLLSRSRLDLERARFATRDSFRHRDNSLRDRCILGCSILLVTSIVFIIIVSGMTTILENRNFPQLQISSSWRNGDRIPLKYGCLAADEKPISFPLRWRNVPRAATNLVILFANAGAMLEKGYDPVHWLVTGIPLNDGAEYYLPANASADSLLMPDGARQHPNANSRIGLYWPPCPEANSSSLFVIHAYAIEAPASIHKFRDAREVMNRFVGVPVAKLTGVYGDAPQTSAYVGPTSLSADGVEKIS